MPRANVSVSCPSRPTSCFNERSGYFNYVGVTDNSPALRQFDQVVQQLLYKWLNRRSQRCSFSWESVSRFEGPNRTLTLLANSPEPLTEAVLGLHTEDCQ